jgi:amino acid transporter
VLSVLIAASITFVAYEGFQLVINAVNEMEKPAKNIPKAIYSAIFLATLIYVVIAVGAILAIPLEDIVRNKEYALASGAEGVLGHWGTDLVILGALLATSSAISGTVFGAARQMAAIARDGYLPAGLATRRRRIPVNAIITMAVCAFALVLAGNLQVILEFGSVTFLLVSLLMAYANFKIRSLTGSSTIVTLVALAGLFIGTVLILYFEFANQPRQLIFIVVIYVILTVGSRLYASRKKVSAPFSGKGC